MNLFILATVSENLSEALSLLAVGMITIFLILALVVLLGKGLIAFVNRFLSPTQIATPQSLHSSPLPSSSFSPSTLSAIVAAVEITTKGTGNITAIKKN